jgi:hypothetical protein
MDCPLVPIALNWWFCPQCGWLYYGPVAPRRNCPKSKMRADLTLGPGDVLHNLMADRLGVGLTLGCNCKAWIEKMNYWGPQGCREKLDKIVDALVAEARRRDWKLDGHPVLSAIAKVGDATPLGGYCARAWARSLVLEAVEICDVKP